MGRGESGVGPIGEPSYIKENNNLGGLMGRGKSDQMTEVKGEED